VLPQNDAVPLPAARAACEKAAGSKSRRGGA